MAIKADFSPNPGMAALARGLSRASRIHVDVETLEAFVIICGIGLAVTFLVATNGLDMSVGSF